MARKQSTAICKGKDADIVNIFDFVVEVHAAELPCGHWQPNLALISTETPDDERGLVTCIYLDVHYPTAKKALQHALRVAKTMQAPLIEDEVFEIFRWTDEDKVLPREYIRLHDDGSKLH